MPNPAAPLPTSVAELNTTAGLLLKAIRVLASRSLYSGDKGHTSDNGLAIDIPTAILLAHTGQHRPPPSLSRSAAIATADQVFADRPVAQAIRFLSVCVAHDAGVAINEELDYLEHLAWWPRNVGIDPDTFETVIQTYDHVIHTIREAADHALDLAQSLQQATNGDQQQLTTAA